MILAPSVLAADFGHLADEISRAEQGGATLVHLDVMDGHFVPNLTMGPAVVQAARRATRLPLDVHLMIEHAELYVDAFADAGANWVSVHVETVPHLQRTVARLRECGLKAGVALNPATPLTFSGNINGGGSLIKGGAGTLQLTNLNTNTGTVNIQGGNLTLTGNGTLAQVAGLIVSNNTTLTALPSTGILQIWSTPLRFDVK